MVIQSQEEAGWTNIPLTPEQVQSHTKDLQDALAALHKPVSQAAEESRRRGRVTQSQGKKAGFEIGDFVMVARVKRRGRQHKLVATWMGPYRVTGTKSEHVFVVQHLLTGAISEHHSGRLSWYADASLHVSQEIKDSIVQLESQGQYDIDKLIAVKDSAETGLQVHVAWHGYEEPEWTWEPLAEIFASAPSVVKA
ncbi:unnamed protein product, partial [Chrysoparadoxa australica]